MRKMWHGTVSVVLATIAVAAGLGNAEARIKCDGAYQVIRGQGHIATPYCEDEYLARVARGYGIRVSGAAIRHNPSRKEEICRTIGHDGRVYATCQKYQDSECSRFDC